MTEIVDLPPGGAIMLDALGAKAILTQPTVRSAQPQLGIVLDLEGKLNKLPQREHRRFLLSVGQAAELAAELAVRSSQAGRLEEFNSELESAVERKRRGE